MDTSKPGPKMPGGFPGKRGRSKRPIEELRAAVQQIDAIRAADGTDVARAARKFGVSPFTYYEYKRRVEAADRAAGYKAEKTAPTRAETPTTTRAVPAPSRGPASPAAEHKREIRDASPADGAFVRVLVFEGSADEVTAAVKSMFYPEG